MMTKYYFTGSGVVMYSTVIVIPELLTFYDRQYRYEVKQLNKETGNGRK
jgi:hypothetical protein